MSELRENIERVQARIADAAARSGRSADAVTLVAVTKTQPAEVVASAAAEGLDVFGENRVQEAEAKAPTVERLLGHAPTWRLIGTLQRNKVSAALGVFSSVDSVDSLRLAAAISSRAAGAAVPILLEVYVGDEPNRPGFRPAELAVIAESVLALPNLDVRGLMTMPPPGLDESGNRAVFRRLRELRDELREKHPSAAWSELSMGMTDDFPIAIEEGATIVRVGRAIFGERT